jgi:hypothetical protein
MMITGKSNSILPPRFEPLTFMRRFLVWTCPVATFLLFNLAAVSRTMAADCVSAPRGLIGWWPGEGNANDLVGVHHGWLANGTTADGNGLVNQAFVFDGVDDWVAIADDPTLRPMRLTVMAWVQFDSLDSPNAAEPGLQYVIFRGNGRQIDYYEGFAIRKIRSQGRDHLSFLVTSVAGQPIIATSAIPVTTNRFYHIAGVYDGSRIQFYVDGHLQGERPICFPLDYDDRGISLGSSMHSYDGLLQGKLDEVALWDRALSSDEIAAVWSAGSGGMCRWVQIIAQPRSQIAAVGQSVAFSVTATGTVALAYQWQANGTNIVGGTNATLTVSNLTPEDAGVYTVVISSAEGRTTSAPALLTLNPYGVSIALYAGVKIEGTVGQTYGIRYTTDLSQSNSWQGLTNVTLSTASQVWYDPQPAALPQRYFRVVGGPIAVP